jgi:alkanesulfonate monooxygenase SsuD/methylene tetrahydromethanopterin reductase-like flavin-dependent oxidoreductase (luciferase family)
MIDVGIGLPMKSLEAEELVEYATTAEQAGFAAISLGERLTYDCHDAMTALTYVAAVTQRLRMMTSVLCTPMYREGILAKQSASLDRLSKGRFQLGLGLGGREADFVVAPAEWSGRGKTLERQIVAMRRIWQGLPATEGALPVGPAPYTPGGPLIIIGGFVDAAMRRAGKFADGIRSFNFAPDPSVHLARYAIAKQAWDEAGRPGRPRLVAACNFALGEGAHEAFVEHAHKYYGYDDALLADALSSNAPTSPQSILDFIARCEDAGIDELVFTAVSTDAMTAMRHLADVVSRRA